jgi:hypothetical protein
VRGATYSRAHPDMASGIAFGFRQSIEEPKEVLNAGDLKSVVYPLADAYESKATAVFLVSHIGTHQRADASGIYVRNFAEIDDERAGIVRANFGLKVEQRRHDQRSAKQQDVLSVLGAGKILNDQGLGRHCPILIENRLLEEY